MTNQGRERTGPREREEEQIAAVRQVLPVLLPLLSPQPGDGDGHGGEVHHHLTLPNAYSRTTDKERLFSHRGKERGKKGGGSIISFSVDRPFRHLTVKLSGIKIWGLRFVEGLAQLD